MNPSHERLPGVNWTTQRVDLQFRNIRHSRLVFVVRANRCGHKAVSNDASSWNEPARTTLLTGAAVSFCSIAIFDMKSLHLPENFNESFSI